MSYSTDKTSAESTENRQKRQSRLVKAALECDRFGRFDVTIRNVSETGIGGQAPHFLTRGERVTVFLPGHKPMPGTVRWVVDQRFGIKTDDEIQITQLRAAQGGHLSSSDSKVEFAIVPPPKTQGWRPGVHSGATRPPPSANKSRW